MIAPQFVQRLPAPASLPNDALRFGPIDDLPGFADQFPGRELLAQGAFQTPATPRPLQKERFEEERRRQIGLHFRRRE